MVWQHVSRACCSAGHNTTCQAGAPRASGQPITLAVRASGHESAVAAYAYMLQFVLRSAAWCSSCSVVAGTSPHQCLTRSAQRQGDGYLRPSVKSMSDEVRGVLRVQGFEHVSGRASV
jgi:hypothetical protein